MFTQERAENKPGSIRWYKIKGGIEENIFFKQLIIAKCCDISQINSGVKSRTGNLKER